MPSCILLINTSLQTMCSSHYNITGLHLCRNIVSRLYCSLPYLQNRCHIGAIGQNAFILKVMTGSGVCHYRQLDAGLGGVTRWLRRPQFRQHGSRCGIYSKGILKNRPGKWQRGEYQDCFTRCLVSESERQAADTATRRTAGPLVAALKRLLASSRLIRNYFHHEKNNTSMYSGVVFGVRSPVCWIVRIPPTPLLRIFVKVEGAAERRLRAAGRWCCCTCRSKSRRSLCWNAANLLLEPEDAGDRAARCTYSRRCGLRLGEPGPPSRLQHGWSRLPWEEVLSPGEAWPRPVSAGSLKPVTSSPVVVEMRTSSLKLPVCVLLGGISTETCSLAIIS